MVKPPVVYNAGLLRRIGARHRRPTTGRGSASSAGQQLFYPPNVGGWDYTRWLDTATFRGRWTAARPGAPGTPAQPRTSRHGPAVRPGDAGRQRARRSGATRRSRPRRQSLLRRLRARRARATRTPTGSSRSTRRCVENALRQLIAVDSPDLAERPMTAAATAAAPSSLRRAVAEAGAGCRGSSPGCRCPAGTGLTPARASSRARRARAARLRRRQLSASPSTSGIARRRDGAARARSSSRSSSRAASTGCRVLYPGRRPALPQAAARTSRSAGGRGRSPRTTGSTGTRAARRSRSSTARARSPSSRRSATPTPTSRTSPRATTGRSARPTPDLQTGWLGRYLDVVGDRRQPAPGAVARRRSSQPSLATAKVPVAAIQRAEPVHVLRAAGLGAPAANRDAQRREHRRASRALRPRPGLVDRGGRSRSSRNHLRRQLAAVRRRRRSPRRSPTRHAPTRSRSGWRGSRR